MRVMQKYTEGISHESDKFYQSFMDFAGEDLLRDLRLRLDHGIDVHGNPFKPLHSVTTDIRTARGNSSTTPLVDSGMLRDGMKARVTGMTIELLSYPEFEEYGKAHNEGFVVDLGDWKGFYAGEKFYATQGTTVGQREFYNIPDSYRPGGAKRKILNEQLVENLEFGFKSAINSNKPLSRNWWKTFKHREFTL
jgi:hypothetical protein